MQQIYSIKTAIRPLSYWRQTHKQIMWIEKDVETMLSNRNTRRDKGCSEGIYGIKQMASYMTLSLHLFLLLCS